YWLNGTVSPLAKAATRNLVYEAIKNDPRSLLDPGVVQLRFPGQKVFIEKRENDNLAGFHLYQLSSDDRDAVPVAYVHAGTVDLRVDTDLKQLKLKLTDAYIETTRENGEVELAFAGEAEPWLFDFSSAQRRKKLKASDLTNAAIPGTIAELAAAHDEKTALLADPELGPRKRTGLEGELRRNVAIRKSMQVELHKRRSLALACFAFACIGVPLGVTARRRETSNGLLISLAVAGGYFGSMVFVDQLSGLSLPLVVGLLWFPNLACLALGAWLFHRASHR
ncbi:MAG: LptF/LptG family permease, partial [Akkermansiaceae bacterium]|nr:LptF/LptG family permease [Akkermansiaceae bacterium]